VPEGLLRVALEVSLEDLSVLYLYPAQGSEMRMKEMVSVAQVEVASRFLWEPVLREEYCPMSDGLPGRGVTPLEAAIKAAKVARQRLVRLQALTDAAAVESRQCAEILRIERLKEAEQQRSKL
jgi:hypothetical protein